MNENSHDVNPSQERIYMVLMVAHTCNCRTQEAEVGFEINLDRVLRPSQQTKIRDARVEGAGRTGGAGRRGSDFYDAAS